MRLSLLPLIMYALVLTGCGEEKKAPPPKVFEGQIKAMEKAKGVEDTLQQQADQQLQDIDQQSQ
jgi:hypothetical protein